MSIPVLIRATAVVVAATAWWGPVLAQEPPPAPAAAPAPASEPAPDSPWSVGLSAGWYVLPDEPDFVQPTIRADWNWLHLEARYAYEDRDSVSFFAGANFEFGDDVKLAVTPMIGALVGGAEGIIPALELDFTVWRLEAYGEAEWVFDLGDDPEDYFYMWSELSLWATDWLRAGMVTQRTRVYQTERDIQRGPLVGVSFSRIETAFYWFNPGANDEFAVLSFGLSF
jgi:hypothetical protein